MINNQNRGLFAFRPSESIPSNKLMNNVPHKLKRDLRMNRFLGSLRHTAGSVLIAWVIQTFVRPSAAYLRSVKGTFITGGLVQPDPTLSIWSSDGSSD